MSTTVSEFAKTCAARIRAAAKVANHKLDGEMRFRGLDVAVENAKGSTRKWFDPHGRETGSTLMHHAYGYIRGTKGTDGDHVDVYIGPEENAADVFIVNQMKKPDFKEFDEHKCLIGFSSLAAARKAYLKQYNDPRFLGSIRALPFEEFKLWVFDKTKTTKKASQQPLSTKTLSDRNVADLEVPAYLSERVASPEKVSRLGTIPLPSPLFSLGGEATALKCAVHSSSTDPELFADRFDRQPGVPESQPFIQVPAPGAPVRPSVLEGGHHFKVAGRVVQPVAVSVVDDLSRKKGAAQHLLHHNTMFEPLAPLVIHQPVRDLVELADVSSSSGSRHETKYAHLSSESKEFKMKVVDKSNHGEKIAQMTRGKWTGAAAALGTALGGGLGALTGAAASDPDQRLRGAAAGALGGAAAGGLGGAAFGFGVSPSRAFPGPQAQLELLLGASGAGTAIFGAPAASALAARHAMQPPPEKIAFAVSPGMLSGLRHAGVGAGIGAAAGGIGGALHAGPEHRGQGAIRGAIAGGALGAAGGAGIAAIKGHGAQQLATLRGSAQEAEQAALKAHNNVRGLNPTAVNFPVEAPRVRNPLDPNATKQFDVRPLTLAQGGSVLHSVDPTMQVAQHQASAAGAKATALGQAANTLEQQQGVMNKQINRAGLLGAAAGTGLMGYMAVPKEYGGIGQKVGADIDGLAAEVQRMKAEKALDDRVGKFDAALDSFGIGALAAPYAAESMGHGLTWAADKIMPRSTRLGAGLATAGNLLERGAKSMHHSNLRELGGLALVTPMVTHPIAHAFAKRSPPPAAAPMPATLAAEKVGRLLAQPKTAAQEKVAINVTDVGKFVWNNKKPLAGAAALVGVGAGLYGAKKVVDHAAEATQPHHASRHYGVPAGMRPPAPAYQSLGS